MDATGVLKPALKSSAGGGLISKIRNIEGNLRMPMRSVTFTKPLNDKDDSTHEVSLGDVPHGTKESDPTQTKVKSSFASVVNVQPLRKVVKINELRNEIKVNGAAVTIEAVKAVNARFVNTLYGYFIGDRLAYPLVENYVKNTWAKYGLKRIQLHEEFFLFQFDTREGMESVLENGPWLIRRVPLILNEWTPNTILKKDEIKRVPFWVKMHYVPIVAYSDIGLSLITTQIGKPLMLDSYTSNMCLHSWGRSTYVRALIEISADVDLMDSLVIAIRLTLNTNGLLLVKKKKVRAKKNSKKQVEGGETSKQKVIPMENVKNVVNGSYKPLGDPIKVSTQNSFSALEEMILLDQFVGNGAIFKPYRISDHSPSVLLSIPSRNELSRSFKFFNVAISWIKDLKVWFVTVSFSCSGIDILQADLDSDPSNVTIREEEAAAIVAFNEALLLEEKLLKQKAKITWLREGDANTAYTFHKLGDVNSATIIKEALDEFKGGSGLNSNSPSVLGWNLFVPEDNECHAGNIWRSQNKVGKLEEKAPQYRKKMAGDGTSTL
ncbi:retrovirus-related pol polyprotein from transposon 17.6 [Tanacetum coccineum]|uniref:Retrovirus-related pol polyprotein from transposon 17.6 n=1 Tax=Tanacetum coccineum TaxID=301880 RepID=A0ABQ5C8F0_9ASTR